MIICPNCAHHDLVKVNILGYAQCTNCGYVFPERCYSLKAEAIQAARKGRCSDYQSNSHACFDCPFAELNINTYICNNSSLDQKVCKVKPRKICRRKV